ncbi:MAG: hypothetical protein GXO87_02550 [Chlorobi bacterium]|nr:hypothetical protein [Chlorobiota bacterium]
MLLKKEIIILISLVVLSGIALLILSQLNLFTEAQLFAARSAVMLNFINTGLALLFFAYSKDKSNQTFLIFNLGGMVFRIFFMLTIIIILIKFLKIDIDAFILVFFIFYFSLLSYEITYFIRYKRKN